MEYSVIDRFLKRSGLGADPAFAHLHFLNEPIPQTQANKIILGLYYPEANHDQYGYLPDSTIHLPADASYHTLLHELGHRHGHYYRNNLTEPYAEKYRIENEYLNPEPSVDPLSLAVNRLCQACPELREGRQICQFCELGGAPARTGPLEDNINLSFYDASSGALITSNQFDPGQQVKVQIKVPAWAYLPFDTVGSSIVFYIYPVTSGAFPPVYATGTLDIAANWNTVITMPDVVAQGTVNLTVRPGIGSPLVITLPVGIGTAPAAPPATPQNILMKVLTYSAIAVGAIAVVWVVAKAAPGISKGIKEARKPA